MRRLAGITLAVSLVAGLRTLAEEPDLGARLKDLDSEEVEVRDRALGELRSLCWRQPGTRRKLQDFAASPASPEAKSRVREAISRVRRLELPPDLRSLYCQVTPLGGDLVKLGGQLRTDGPDSEYSVDISIDTRRGIVKSVERQPKASDAPQDDPRKPLRDRMVAALSGSSEPAAREFLDHVRSLEGHRWKDGWVFIPQWWAARPVFFVSGDLSNVLDLSPPKCDGHDGIIFGDNGLICWIRNLEEVELNRRLHQELGTESEPPQPVAWHLSSPTSEWNPLPEPPGAFHEFAHASVQFVALAERSGKGAFWDIKKQSWQKFPPPAGLQPTASVQLCDSGVFEAETQTARFLDYASDRWLDLDGLEIPSEPSPERNQFIQGSLRTFAADLGAETVLVWVWRGMDWNPAVDMGVEAAFIIDVTSP